jgi:uncharacterized protein (DUF302 family)
MPAPAKRIPEPGLRNTFTSMRRRLHMKRLLLALILAGLTQVAASADNGLISVKSAHDVATTTNRLVDVLVKHGMTIFAQVDHAAGAKQVEMSLPPTELVIFGNPKVGTVLMKCGRSIGIDLPLKALVWEDDHGRTWLSYNDPRYLGRRHGLKGCEKALGKVDKALAGFAEAATE